MTYRKVHVLYKQENCAAAQLAENICIWLQSRGIRAVRAEADRNKKPDFDGIDLVLILGGDGTILGVARHLAGSGIPFFGINFGRVGFLTACGPGEWQDELEEIFSGDRKPQASMVLRWQLFHGELCRASGHAINEVVLGRGRLARLTPIEVTINSDSLGVVRSDALLICTPVGSTAYCASAGGPILFPSIQATVLLAICPFLARFSPMVLPKDSEFILKPFLDSAPCWCTIDGQEDFELGLEDRLVIRSWPDAILYFGNDAGFFGHLSLCGNKKGAKQQEKGQE